MGSLSLLQGISQPRGGTQVSRIEGGFFSQSVQSFSRVRLFVTLWTAARQASLSIINSQNLLRLMSIESVMLSNHLFSSCLQSFPESRSFPMISSSHQVAKVLEFQLLTISPSREYSGLISFRMDWLDLCAVQGTLKSLLQCSQASVL